MKKLLDENMILRSVYLPPELDHKIGALAFAEAVSKGDVIRDMLEKGIAASGKVGMAERLATGAKARKEAARRKASAKRKPKAVNPHAGRLAEAEA